MTPPYVVLITGSSKGAVTHARASLPRARAEPAVRPCLFQPPLRGPPAPCPRQACGMWPLTLAPTRRRPAPPPLPPPQNFQFRCAPGVGRALAEEFLRAGDSVVVCARNGAAGGAQRGLRVVGGAEAGSRAAAGALGWCRDAPVCKQRAVRSAPPRPAHATARPPPRAAGDQVSEAVDALGREFGVDRVAVRGGGGWCIAARSGSSYLVIISTSEGEVPRQRQQRGPSLTAAEPQPGATRGRLGTRQRCF